MRPVPGSHWVTHKTRDLGIMLVHYGTKEAFVVQIAGYYPLVEYPRDELVTSTPPTPAQRERYKPQPWHTLT